MRGMSEHLKIQMIMFLLYDVDLKQKRKNSSVSSGSYKGVVVLGNVRKESQSCDEMLTQEQKAESSCRLLFSEQKSCNVSLRSLSNSR